MKTMKRLFAGSVALLVMLSVLLTSAFASSGNDATFAGYDKDNSTTRYVAYQIFNGSTQDAAAGHIGNVDWGSGINGDAFLAALKADTAFGTGTANIFYSCTTAADVASAIGAQMEAASPTWQDDDQNAYEFARLADIYKKGSGTPCVNGTTPLPAGYYLIVDTIDLSAVGNENVTRNLSLLQLTHQGTFQVNVKATSPQVEKKVFDQNTSYPTTDPENENQYQDSADLQKGDMAKFRVKATLGNISGFTAYKLQFVDSMDPTGYDVTSASNIQNVAIRLYTPSEDSNDPAAGKLVTSAFTQDNSGLTATPAVVTWTCNDLKAISIPGVDVSFLDNTGVSSSATVVLYYEVPFIGVSNGTTGYENKAHLVYSNDATLNSDGSPKTTTSQTPDDKVEVYTHKVEVTKHDNAGNPLTGAEFSLEKWNASASAWQAVTSPAQVKSDIGTVANCVFTWNGLDDGIYRLTETTTPAGYNTADPVLFCIDSTHSVTADDPTLTAVDVYVVNVTSPTDDTPVVTTTADTRFSGKTLDATVSLLPTTVVNNRGPLLPETGGAGTTMIYVTGSVLLLGGIVLLITKRRMGR